MAEPFDWLFAQFDNKEPARESEESVDVFDPVERRKQLEGMKDAGGTIGQIATELLAAMDDREKAATRASQLEDAEELSVEGIGSLMASYEALRFDADADSEEVVALGARVEAVKDALRAQTEADRAQEDAAFLRNMEALYHDPRQGFGDETIAEKMAVHREELAEAQALRVGSDALDESPLWNAYLTQSREQARAHELAVQLTVERPDYVERELASAQAANDSLIDQLVDA